nr:reverse transcriptase domain-containing protein [Tanacetum cinerariifolium]
MADQRTMAQLLQAPTEGYEDAIVVPAITTDNFKFKRGLLTLVQNKQFFGHDKEDPHAHPVVAKVSTNTSTSSITPDVAELKDMVKALLLDKKSQKQALATVKAVEQVVRAKQRNENLNLEEHYPPVVTMADQCTMAQLLQAPIKGYEDAIVVPGITADNFELKHGLLTLIQNKQLYGHDKEDPHAHIRYLNKITSTLK